jgi:cellulose synthase operon protein YhjQ
MIILPIVSAKGGVGKTTVTANLAAGLTQIGHTVLVLDLDPQNALRLHFAMDIADNAGIGPATLVGQDWADVAQNDKDGVLYLPYGRLSERQRIRFEAILAQQSDWLTRGLQSFSGSRQIVLIDTPPGPSAYLPHALRNAHWVLVVLLAQAGTYATLPSMISLMEEYCSKDNGFRGAYHIINRFNASRRLDMDVRDAMRAMIGGDMASCEIHEDETVHEALASRQLVHNYDQHCRASHDIACLAGWVSQLLGQG